jgi:hypothetical protein
MSHSAFSSLPGFAPPPAPEKRSRAKACPRPDPGWIPVGVKKRRQSDRTPTGRLGLGCQMRYTAVRAYRDSRTIPVLRRKYEETKRMAVDGNWNITMSTPMGDRNETLSLKNSGGKLTGTLGADGNSTEIFDGTANGDDVAWKVSITNPMPLTLEFTGKVSGDTISGEMGIGPMGSFPFKGTRA